MTRSAGRRIGQRGRERGEEYAEEQAPRVKEEFRQPGEGDSAIAEMARGFVEAQSKLNTEPAMLALLEKISRQLDELRQSPAGGQPSSSSQYAGNQASGNQAGSNPPGNNQAGGSSQSAGQQAAPPQKAATPRADDLAAIFSSLLQGSGAGRGGGQADSGGASPQQQDKNGQGPAASTAAQMLSQAQYELANELEASLEKLKKVIDESEKLAGKISNLLGQENSENTS